MSLFPAYSQDEKKDETNTSYLMKNQEGALLGNESFVINPTSSSSLQNKAQNECVDASEKPSEYMGDTESFSLEGIFKQNLYQHSKKDHSRKVPIEMFCEFTGQQEFYVDKCSMKQYNAIKTLYKPACPSYKVHYHTLGKNFHNKKRIQKRYYQYSNEQEQKKNVLDTSMKESEYSKKMCELNRKAIENCHDLQTWIDLINLQDGNPYKWSRVRVAEKKLDYVQKALTHNPGRVELYKIYISIITQAYTSHDVNKMLEHMLSKDPFSVILWQALIMCTQGTMARCTVPEVLRIYERCMKKMFHNHQQSAKIQDGDSVMLELFYSCCLFLRQAGLYEQFFALIKLAIELNVVISNKLLEDLQPIAQNEQTLMEYEEMILQSGLPMNEIWLRIEKLRQSFNFLPFPGNKTNCDDPQRIVFNEDICHYVYPLKSQKNSFKLLITILKLLKLPFIGSHTLAIHLHGDTDAVEDILAVYVNPHYICSWDQKIFFSSLFDISKEMINAPTFLCTSIANEEYSQCLKNLLINCSEYFKQIDEKKRLIFLQLWCRFERLLLIQEKLNGKLTLKFIQETRKRFKNLLKQSENRNCLQLYIEFALLEIESEASVENVDNIFNNILVVYKEDENLQSELASVYLTYAEILIKTNRVDKASDLLAQYCLNLKHNLQESTTSVRKILALSKMREKLDDIIQIEQNTEIMELEQYFMTDYTLTQINIYCLLCYTLQQKQQSCEYMQTLLEIFKSQNNSRHIFLKEHVYEIFIKILQLHKGNSYVSQNLIERTIYQGLQEYPNNLYLLQKWGCQHSMPWYKVRAGFIKFNPSIKSVIYLIAVARCRFINSLTSSSFLQTEQLIPIIGNDFEYHELLVRQRILNLFQELILIDTTRNSLPTLCLYSSLRRNSLFWRLYLSCLSDQSCSFELSKKCLLAALDECPWSKALYLEGAKYVPQELSHLQDLIIEKQLRIYALPEELVILRER